MPYLRTLFEFAGPLRSNRASQNIADSGLGIGLGAPTGTQIIVVVEPHTTEIF
jgi:hypothetical protein